MVYPINVLVIDMTQNFFADLLRLLSVYIMFNIYFTVSVSFGIGRKFRPIFSFGVGIGSETKKVVSVVHYILVMKKFEIKETKTT